MPHNVEVYEDYDHLKMIKTLKSRRLRGLEQLVRTRESNRNQGGSDE